MVVNTSLRVFTTDPDDPDEGRTFLWADQKWFERVEASTGPVEFMHLADSEPEFHQWLEEEEGLEPSDLTELERDEEFYRIVHREFLDEAPPYLEAAELSDEEPFSEQELDTEEVRGFHREP